jgi:hypothetical protein
VAIIDDIKKDSRTRRVLAQTNTKTVSVPSASTGLVGDSQPAEVFTASDFDLVKNQVHIQEENFQLMEALNVMGQLTNMQSQSGPIPGTMKMANTGRIVASTNTTLFQPDAGQVWVCSGVQIDASAGSGSVTAVLNYFDGTNEVRIEAASTAGIAEFNITSTAGPLYVSSDVYLRITTSSVGAGEECVVNGAFVRVR